MKTLFLTAILAITLVSCNHKTKETENKTSLNSNEIFACSIHPEVKLGKNEWLLRIERKKLLYSLHVYGVSSSNALRYFVKALINKFPIR